MAPALGRSRTRSSLGVQPLLGCHDSYLTLAVCVERVHLNFSLAVKTFREIDRRRGPSGTIRCRIGAWHINVLWWGIPQNSHLRMIGSRRMCFIDTIMCLPPAWVRIHRSSGRGVNSAGEVVHVLLLQCSTTAPEGRCRPSEDRVRERPRRASTRSHEGCSPCWAVMTVTSRWWCCCGASTFSFCTLLIFTVKFVPRN